MNIACRVYSCVTWTRSFQADGVVMHNVYKGIREWRKTDWVLFGLGCAFLTASVVIMLVGQIG